VSPTRSRFFIAVLLLAVSTLAGGAFAALLFASPERETPPLDEYADILTTLSEWAPETVPPEQFVYASVHGMLSRLDPHTAFLEPEDFSAMREKQQGSFFGLGIQIRRTSWGSARATSSRTSKTKRSRKTRRRTRSSASCAAPRAARSRSRFAAPGSTNRSR
jgi:hypothetical protein